jgi:GTPase Era involved in 16S rRNA processing
MKQHRLGPNGAIMTSLNLFSTKFDQVSLQNIYVETRSVCNLPHYVYSFYVINLYKNDKVMTILENRAYSPMPNSTNTEEISKKNLDYILVDTPGQIEAFTWSASGTIITSALSSAFPTVLAFVVDTPRCVASLNTFMSNMLYACSMFYRTRLPLIVVFNKSDVVGSEVCMEWMDSYETFQEAMDEFMSTEGGQGFYSSLTRSLSLVLDEFYAILKKVGVSAATGDGIAEFWKTVEEAADDFDLDYVSDLQCKIEEQNAKKRALAKESIRRMQRDIAEDNET